MQRYKMVIAYDGTPFAGWQVQPNKDSIQFLIQKALKTILREDICLTGSGRTDAGVHATGQTAHFSVEKGFSISKLTYGLNSILPQEIRILSIEETSLDFHARYSAKGKIYSYHLSYGPCNDPFYRHYRWHIYSQLDTLILKKAALLFEGTHDFSSFAHHAHLGSASRNPIKTLYSLTVTEEKNSLKLEFFGDGFLYKMVRNIVGTLVEVALHKLDVEEIEKIFFSKDRRKAGRTAPPQGLFLEKVLY